MTLSAKLFRNYSGTVFALTLCCARPVTPPQGSADGGADVLQCGDGCARVATMCAKPDGWNANCVATCTESWTVFHTDMHAERWQSPIDARAAGFLCP